MRRTFGTATILLFLVIAGWRLRTVGLAAASLHPDEPQHLQWLEQTVRHGRPLGRLYPAGYFRFVRPFRSVAFFLHRQHAAARYRAGYSDRPDGDPFPDRLFLRRFNSVLSLLGILLLFAFAFSLTRSMPGAIAAAFFWTFNPIAIEHAHYATPDTAAVFFFLATLCSWAIALRTSRFPWFFLGCLFAALAAGTKFGLLILLGPLLVIPFYLPSPNAQSNGPVPIRRRLAWTLAGLTFFFLVLIWTNPFLQHWSAFRAEWLRQQNGLQTEFRRTLSLYADDPAAARAARLLWLSGHAADMGPLFLLLAGTGFFLALFAPSLRRFRPLLVLFPALALLAALLFAPFLRKQEFLLFVPLATAWATLPIGFPPRFVLLPAPVLRPLVAILAAAAAFHTTLQGCRIASFFEWPDTREQARRWMVVHGPTDRSVATERSADHVLDGNFSSRSRIYKVEDVADGFDALGNPVPEFVIRNAFAVGRGFYDLFSKELLPRHREIWTRFSASYVRLAQWAPLSHPRLNPGHHGHAVELYSRTPARISKGWSLTFLDPAPLLLSEQGREIYFPDSGCLGSRWAVPIQTIPREIGWGGPSLSTSNLWFALIGGESDSTVVLAIGFRRMKITVPQRAILPVAFPRPLLLDLLPPSYVRIRVWAKPNRFHPNHEPAAFLLPGPSEAMLAAWKSARFDLLPHLLQSGVALPAHDLFRMAIQHAKPEEALRYREAAIRILTQLENPGAMETLEWINGRPAYAYDAFSRLREPCYFLKPAALESSRSSRKDPPSLQQLDDSLRLQLGITDKGLAISRKPLRSTVRLSPGRYTLKMEIRPSPADSGCPPNETILFHLADAEGRILHTGLCTVEEFGLLRRISLDWTVAKQTTPQLFLISTRPLLLLCQNLEWRWTLASRLDQLRRELQDGLSRLPSL